MGRKKAGENVRRDDKGRILPTGVTYRKTQKDYMWRMTYKGVSYPPVYDKDLSELKRRIPALKAAIYEEAESSNKEVTLNKCFEGMLREKEDINPVTRVNYRKYWIRHIQGDLGMKITTKITKEMIRKKYKKLMEEDGANLSWGTVKYIHALVYASFEWGIDNSKHKGRNPANKALKGLDHEEADGERPLTESEERIFFNFVDNHKHFKYHATLLHTLRDLGLRAGEGIGLCEDALHFEEGYIDICRSLNYKDNVGDGKRRKYFSSTKSDCSVRTLPALSYVQENIEKYLEMREMIGRECIENIEGHSDFVFVTQQGTAYTVDYLDQLIHRIINSYNKKEEEAAEKENRQPILLEHFSSHAFRHTFGQHLKDEGADEITIRDWLGHADTRATKIYAKPNWKSIKKTTPESLNAKKVS